MKTSNRSWPRALAARVAYAAALFALASCSDDHHGLIDARRELQGYRALWGSRHITDYRFVQQKSCFCGGDYREAMLVEVRGGIPVTVRTVSDGRLLPNHLAMTVSDVFDRIEDALDGDYKYLTVAYDPEMGFPVEVSMNPGDDIADGGFDIVCSGMTPLAAVESCDDPPIDPACHCPAELPELAYRYTAYDSNGRRTVEGCAVLTFTPKPENGTAGYVVTGHRCFSAVCGTHPDEAHTGTNDIQGTLTPEGQLSLDLNDGWADSNIFLTATVSGQFGGYVSGAWTYSTLHGPVNQGTFLLDRTE